MSVSPTVSREAALAAASVPTLLMCLAHLTGDEKWLRAPYLPKRDVALFADPSGGLPDDVQQSAREAMAKVLDELASGARAMPGPLEPARALEMMRVCLNERVPPEYAPMAMEEMGFVDRSVHWREAPAPARLADFEVLVVGAGLSGLCAAIRMQEMGIRFSVVEKNPDVGGTWFENDYPEAGVDTPNHFYSFSFAPNLHWTSNYSKRGEVWEYLKQLADRFELRCHIRFGVEVEACAGTSPVSSGRCVCASRTGSAACAGPTPSSPRSASSTGPRWRPFPAWRPSPDRPGIRRSGAMMSRWPGRRWP